MKIKIDGNEVAHVLNAKREPYAQKLVLTALDGTAYAQSTGSPVIKYVIDVFCSTAARRDALDNACSYGSIIELVFDDETSVEGIIEDEVITWKEFKDRHGVGHFTMIKS